jgi:hypothetical protein
MEANQMNEYYSKKHNITIKINNIYNGFEVLEIYKQSKYTKVKFKCHCGNIGNTEVNNIIRNKVKSCGCIKRKLAAERFQTHGYFKKWWYTCYYSMIHRCHFETNTNYKNYGGREIRVCDDWNYLINDMALFNFDKWITDNNFEFDKNITIERIDVNKGYCPENCTFIPKKEQTKNRRNTRMFTIDQETKSLIDWLKDERCMVKGPALCGRLERGWSFEKALTEPEIQNNKPKFFTLGDQCKSINDWARDDRCKVSKSGLRKRLLDGWAVEEALNTLPNKRIKNEKDSN